MHVTAIKPRRDQTEQEAVGAAAAEALKYALKPSDMMEDAEWSRAVAKVSHGRRFLGTGGALKGILAGHDDELEDVTAEDEAKPLQEEPAQLVHHVAYSWSGGVKKYRRAPEKDEMFSPAEAKAKAQARAMADAVGAETAEEFSSALHKVAKAVAKRGRPKRAQDSKSQ